MKRIGIAFLLTAALGLALAESANEILARIVATLDAGPWQARLVGKVLTPTGGIEPVEIVLRAIPEAGVVRADFIKPDALADNYVVRTRDKVYNYLFLTNRVVVYPIERAKIEGLGFDFAKGGNPKALAERDDVRWTLAGEAKTPGGPAWQLKGAPENGSDLGFASAELWVLKNPVRPYRMVFRDAEGALLADLTFAEWKRAKFRKEDLVEFPLDAEFIEK